MEQAQLPLEQHISLCDALDRVLNKGVVIYGDISISVAGVDLLYIGLRGLICAVDALETLPPSLCSNQGQGIRWEAAP